MNAQSKSSSRLAVASGELGAIAVLGTPVASNSRIVVPRVFTGPSIESMREVPVPIVFAGGGPISAVVGKHHRCLFGKSLRQRLAGLCQRKNASVWVDVKPTGRRVSSGQVLAFQDGTLHALMSKIRADGMLVTQVSMLDETRLSWRLVGPALQLGKGAVATLGEADNAPVVTARRPRAERLVVRRLNHGRWNSLLSASVARRASRLGHGPLLGGPVELGGKLVLGYTKVRDGQPWQFGLLSLSTGRFTKGPAPSTGNQQGSVLRTVHGVWAVWREDFVDQGEQFMRTTVSTLTPREQAWSGDLRAQQSLGETRWVFDAPQILPATRSSVAIVPFVDVNVLKFRSVGLRQRLDSDPVEVADPTPG